MVGKVALLNSTMLTATPMPFTLAEDGYLPPFLTRRHPRYGTPWIAILISAAIYASLALHSLGELISIYGWLRGATTVLTVLSVWELRRKQPGFAASLPHSRRQPRTYLRDRHADGDDLRRLVLQCSRSRCSGARALWRRDQSFILW